MESRPLRESEESVPGTRDVEPPPGGVSVSKLKLLFPADWADFIATRPPFAKEWDRMVGLK